MGSLFRYGTYGINDAYFNYPMIPYSVNLLLGSLGSHIFLNGTMPICHEYGIMGPMGSVIQMNMWCNMVKLLGFLRWFGLMWSSFFFRSTSLMRKIEETPHWGFFFGIDYSLRSFLGPPVLWGLLIDFHDYIFNRDQLWSTIICFFFLHHRGDVDEVPSRHLIIPSRNQPWQWNMAYDSYESRCFSWFNGYSNIIKPWFNHHHL